MECGRCGSNHGRCVLCTNSYCRDCANTGNVCPACHRTPALNPGYNQSLLRMRDEQLALLQERLIKLEVKHSSELAVCNEQIALMQRKISKLSRRQRRMGKDKNNVDPN